MVRALVWKLLPALALQIICRISSAVFVSGFTTGVDSALKLNRMEQQQHRQRSRSASLGPRPGGRAPISPQENPVAGKHITSCSYYSRNHQCVYGTRCLYDHDYKLWQLDDLPQSLDAISGLITLQSELHNKIRLEVQSVNQKLDYMMNVLKIPPMPAQAESETSDSRKALLNKLSKQQTARLEVRKSIESGSRTPRERSTTPILRRRRSSLR